MGWGSTLKNLPSPEAQKFVLVDGLDECLDNPGVGARQSVISVLKLLRGKLPRWLTIVATARRDDRVNKQLQTFNANVVIDLKMYG